MTQADKQGGGRVWGKRWSREEQKVLCKACKEGKTSYQAAALLPERTLQSVRSKGHAMGLTFSRRGRIKEWTADELMRLKAACDRGARVKQAASEIPGRTRHAIEMKAYRSGWNFMGARQGEGV